MKPKKKYMTTVVAVMLCLIFGWVLMLYAAPMEDVSMDLSLSLNESQMPEEYSDKGWTVYTRDADAVNELEPDGFGGFIGLELGQTFYFSRLMGEELDSPTLQIATVNRSFAVWLDDTLIYTDCPDLDNRIGYVTLPMFEWDRQDPVIISLPSNYQGKTLTIAQSFPDYTEASSVRAYPAGVKLYCGYAYESGLISESFRAAIFEAAVFLVGAVLLIAFVRSGDWSVLCLALVAFLWMLDQITEVSFFWKYFGSRDNSLFAALPLLSAGFLLVFLALRGEKHRKILWWIIAAYGCAVAAYIGMLCLFTSFSSTSVLAVVLMAILPYWLAFAGVVAVLVLGGIFWRKQNWFYRVFTPLALAGIALYWIAIIFFLEKGIVGEQIVTMLRNGQLAYIYFRVSPAVTLAAMLTAVADAVRAEISRRTEGRLVEDRLKLVQESYENMRCPHEEVLMIRHDMTKHLLALRSISDRTQAIEYIDTIIGQNEKIHSVIQSGNEMLDIILNSKLSSARDSGIRVEVVRANAPERLPIPDAELCSLIMNAVDNAVAAAHRSGADAPFIRLDIHVKNEYLSFVCENSMDVNLIERTYQTETVPKRGLGLKIIRRILEQYHGLIETEYGNDRCRVQIALPLD